MLSPGQGLLRVEALALWHLVGHPPQDTHLDKTDSTFCAKFMIMDVPCKFEPTAFPKRNPKEDNQTFVDHHVKISMILQVREESVLSSYHRNIVVSSLDADHNEPQHPPAKTVSASTRKLTNGHAKNQM